MKNVNQKYRKLTDVEHVLLRPGMYVGSTKHKTEEVHIVGDENRFVSREVTYNPAFIKIFDEIISNSVDEHRRNPKLNLIKVIVDQKKNIISVRDNGGIPVLKHQEYDEWIPEMIFSNLKAGSNFDDSEERLVAGTNGVGSTLTNIFSKKFIIKTCDKKNVFEQTFSENMKNRSEASVTPTNKPGYTEITYAPDLSQFNMTEIDDDHIEVMKKRLVDCAACNPKLRVTFNGESYKFISFIDYCRMYSSEVIYDSQSRWSVGFAPSNGSFQQVSFVNSVETKDGGTHVDNVATMIVDQIRERVRKKHKHHLKPSEIKNQIFLFVQSDIVNPAFSSQTKEKLITEVRDFGSKFELKPKMVKEILSSEVIQQILDWAEKKAAADERKKLRVLNKNIAKGKVIKLIDAKARTNRHKCTLALFEGDSASSAFRKYRDPKIQGAFPLRGKFINITDMPASRVIKNQEVKNLLIATGLKMGEEPKNLRYGKILIYADADPDGDSIAGLLINFFGRYWPELFDEGRICRVMTPLVVAKRGKTTKWFYTNDKFDEWLSKCKDTKKWDVAYKKGLASLEDEEYREIIHNPKLFAISGGKRLIVVLDAWFGKDPIHRKEKILGTQSQEKN